MNKYFEYNDDTANSHKFWQISQKSKNVTVSYGRIGIANPHQIVKEFDNKDLALAFAEKKIEEKYGKNFLWLLYPEDNQLFNDFMKNKINPEHLNYNFINRKYLSKN